MYLPDILWFVALQGLILGAGLVAARLLVPRSDVITLLVAAATLSWAWVTLGMQALGFAGYLARASLLGWSVLGLALPLVLRLIQPPPPNPVVEPALPGKTSRSDKLLLILTSALLLWLVLTLTARSLMSPVKVVSDGPIYHLYFASRWWQDGLIHWIASPFGESAATYFPANGELWFCWLITSWGGDRFARVGQFPFLLLSCFTLYGLIRRIGCSVSASYLAVAWFATLLPLALFSLEPNVDTIFLAGYLASVYFVFLYLDGEARASYLILAGLAAGLALGTKPTALVFVPPWLVIASGLIFKMAPGHNFNRRWMHVLGLWGGCLLTSGAWMVRNWAATGNPWYPLHLEILGAVVLQGWYPRSAMWKSPFYLPVSNWRALIDNLAIVLDARLAIVWVVAIVGLWGWRSNRVSPRSRRWIVWFCLLGLLNVGLYWFLIPYRTQQRFMLHGIALLSVPLAALFQRGWGIRWLGLGLLAIHLLTYFNWPFAPAAEIPPWSLEKMIAPVSDAMIRIPMTQREWSLVTGRPSIPQEALQQGYYRMRLALAGISLGLAAVWVLVPRSIRSRAVLVAGGSGLALAIACTWIGWGLGTLNIQYPDFEYYPAWTYLEGLSPPQGARISYAGTNLPYYLLGKGLRNHVVYVNIDEHPTWQMHEYRAAEVAARGAPLWNSPRPGWDRLHPNYEAWLSNLRAQRIDFLFVTRANPAEGEFNCVDPEYFTIERTWADDHPEQFTLIYGGNILDPRTSGRPDGRVRIYRIVR